MVNLGKEEAVAVSDCNDTSSLRQCRLVALRQAIKRLDMRFLAHSGHVDKVKISFFLDGEDRVLCHLQQR